MRFTTKRRGDAALARGASISHCYRPAGNWSVGLVLLLAVSCASPSNQQSSGITTVRIGWQTAWATQGQIVEALKHTNALQTNDLGGEFVGFSYGAPLNQAALAGAVDVVLTADQPAMTLLAHGGRFTVVARLMYNRVAIYVPPDSSIRSIADLRGKTVGIPLGAAAQRDAFAAMEAAGLTPGKNVKISNVDIYQETTIIHSGSNSAWPGYDALVGFDPTIAILEQTHAARMLHTGVVVAMVLVSNDLLSKGQAALRFLRAYVEAWHYYANNQSQAGAWYLTDSKLTFTPTELQAAAAVEPNVTARSYHDLNVTFNVSDIAQIESAAEFIVDNGLATIRVNVSQVVSQNLVTVAQAQLIAHPVEPVGR